MRSTWKHRLLRSVVVISMSLLGHNAVACAEHETAYEKYLDQIGGEYWKGKEEKWRTVAAASRLEFRSRIESIRRKIDSATTETQLADIVEKFEDYTENTNNDSSGLIEIYFARCLAEKKQGLLNSDRSASAAGSKSASDTRQAATTEQGRMARGGSGGGSAESEASQEWFAERADQWNRCGNALNAELNHKSSMGRIRVIGADLRLDFGTPINEYCRKWMLRGFTFEGPQTIQVRSSVKQVGEPRLEEDEPCPFVAANETPIGQCAVLKVKSLLDYSNPPFLLRQSLIRGYNKEQCFEFQIDLRFGCQSNTNTSYCIMDGENRQCLQRSGMPLWDPRKAQLPEAAAMTLYRDVGAGEYNTHGSALRLSGNIAGGPNIKRNVTVKARECRKPGVPTDFLEAEGCLVNRSSSLTTRWPFSMGDAP